MHGGDERCTQILVRKGNRQFGKPRCRWKDNIKMYLKEIGWEGLDSSGSGQGPVAGCCEHGNEPSGSIKGGEFLDQLSE
jgi:hypothetical protein